MGKLIGAVFLAVALVATNAVRKSNIEIKMEFSRDGEKMEINQLDNFEEDSIENIYEDDFIENDDFLMPSDSNNIDDSDYGVNRFIRFGSRGHGSFYFLIYLLELKSRLIESHAIISSIYQLFF